MSKIPNSTKNSWRRAVDGVLEALKNMKYSEETIRKHRLVYRRFLQFLDNKKKNYSIVPHKIVDSFLRHRGMPALNATQKRSDPEMKCRKALRFLLEFRQRGSFDQRQKSTRRILLPSSYEPIFMEYQEYRAATNASTSERGEKQHLDDIRDFLHVLHRRRIFSLHKIRFDDVQAYVGKNPKLSTSRISHKICAVRSFFRFVVTTKDVPAALLRFLPRIRNSGVFRLAAIWPQAAVKKLLSVINRKTALGKRNYAIVLLVSKLGLRIGDVRNLKIENIDWRKAIIRVTQQKTKNSQELPMSEDIGRALLDYLKNGRPNVSSRHVFVTHYAPYKEFSVKSGLITILAQYRDKAGILLPKESCQGWHSLRHSLATRLHEESTPLPVIATILGHASIETTRIYARTNINMLRAAALEWEES